MKALEIAEKLFIYGTGVIEMKDNNNQIS